MLTIHLHNLVFYAFHGLHEEETALGGKFEVSIDISFPASGKITSLSETIDYVKVYETIRLHMERPSALLETLAQDITNAIFLTDKRINNINITINKLNPPISGFTGKVGVSFSKAFL